MEKSNLAEKGNLNDIGISAKGSSEIDFQGYRLSQDFETLVGTKKETLTIPVKRPEKQWWFQIRPGEEWKITFALIELTEDREYYLVVPQILPSVSQECIPKLLVLCQTRQGVLFFWPIRMPDSEGKIDSWNRSALQIVNEFEGQWIRVLPNKVLGAYEVMVGGMELQTPTWPQGDINSFLQKAFRDKIIDRLDHPVIQKLQGLKL